MRPLLRLLSPPALSGRLSILIFHRVLAQADPLFPDDITAQRFDAICSWIAQWFNVLPLDEAASRLASGQLPARAACITFDDGYRDNHDQALPILLKHGLTATFFVATGFIDGGRMWNDTLVEAVRNTQAPELNLSDLALGPNLQHFSLPDNAARRTAIHSLLRHVKYLAPTHRNEVVATIAAKAGVCPRGDLMMTSNQVKALRSAGMQIGAHTVTHPILRRLDEAQVRSEIGRSREELQGWLQEPVTLFAYPNGKPGEDYGERDAAIVKALGFNAAVSTSWGAAGRGSNPFELPRFTPWDATRMRFGLRLARNLLVG